MSKLRRTILPKLNISKRYKQSVYARDRKKTYFHVCVTFINLSTANIAHIQLKYVIRYAMAKNVPTNVYQNTRSSVEIPRVSVTSYKQVSSALIGWNKLAHNLNKYE